MAVTLLIWAVGYFAVNTSQKALQKSTGEHFVSLTVATLNKIDRDIYDKIKRFQTFGDPSLPETLPAEALAQAGPTINFYQGGGNGQ